MKMFLFLVSLGLVSCSDSVRKVATPKPTEAQAEVTGKPLGTLKRGYGVYMKHCSQCHEHRLPNTVKFSEWTAHINTMSDRAGLSKEERADLQVYLGELSDR